MSGPISAQVLPKQLPNSSAPIALVEGEVTLYDDERKPVSGHVSLSGIVTLAWRYFFGLFAQTTTLISPTFSQTISNPPTQAEVQALSDQVSLLSAQIGRDS